MGWNKSYNDFYLLQDIFVWGLENSPALQWTRRLHLLLRGSLSIFLSDIMVVKRGKRSDKMQFQCDCAPRNCCVELLIDIVHLSALIYSVLSVVLVGYGFSTLNLVKTWCLWLDVAPLDALAFWGTVLHPANPAAWMSSARTALYLVCFKWAFTINVFIFQMMIFWLVYPVCLI